MPVILRAYAPVQRRAAQRAVRCNRQLCEIFLHQRPMRAPDFKETFAGVRAKVANESDAMAGTKNRWRRGRLVNAGGMFTGEERYGTNARNRKAAKITRCTTPCIR